MVRRTRFCELLLTSQLCALLCCKNLFIILQFIWHCCCCCSTQSQTSRYRFDYCHSIRIVYSSAYRFKTRSAVCKNNKYGRSLSLSLSMTIYHYFKLMSAIYVYVYMTCRCRLVIQHFFLTYSLVCCLLLICFILFYNYSTDTGNLYSLYRLAAVNFFVFTSNRQNMQKYAKCAVSINFDDAENVRPLICTEIE